MDCLRLFRSPRYMIDDRILQLLARKLSGEATAAERAELERLLSGDPGAVYYVELISQLWEDEKFKKSAPGASTDTPYLKHIAKHGPRFQSPGPVRRHPLVVVTRNLSRSKWMRAAAILIIPVVAVALWVWYPRHTGAAQNLPVSRENAVFIASAGTRRMMELPDGTRVWLNGGSRLTYDSNMQKDPVRAVTLSGEAFFDVAKNKDRGFVIHTERIDVRVLGTSFNIRAYPQDRVTEATLMHGSIELTVNNKPYHKIILRPKEKFALVDDGTEELNAAANHKKDTLKKEKLIVQEITPIEVADKEYVKEVSWVDNEFVFQDETLEELAPKMERWFNVTMEIENPAIRRFHFTGIFQKETIDQALQAMQLIKPFKYKMTDSHVFIY